MKILVPFLLFFSVVSCVNIRQNYNCGDFPSPSRNLNVCKHLKDSVILYAVFIDVAEYHLFSEFDINSTMDSVNKAVNWINFQAELSQKPLGIKPIRHISKGKYCFSESKTLAKLHPFKTNHRNYIDYINEWADMVSKYAGRGFKVNRSSKIAQKISIYNLESFIRALRDKFDTDNIAFMFFLNGYMENDPSFSLNSYTDKLPEFSVITSKNPAIIAHEFLNLFGAVDLYPNSTHTNFNFSSIEKTYPNEIMRITHKNLSKLEISPITKYYIGWKNDLSESDLRMLYHKAQVLEY